MHRRRIPFLIRAIILFLASLPLARAAATSAAEAHGLRGAHVREVGVAGRAALVEPAAVVVGVALVSTTQAIEARPAAEPRSQAAVSRAISRPGVRARAGIAGTALTHLLSLGLPRAAMAPARPRGIPVLPSLAPFPYKARSLAGTLTARAP